MENKISGKNWWEMTEEELNELHKKLWRNPKAVEQSQEDNEIRPKIIYQEDYQKTRLYNLADEYVDTYIDDEYLSGLKYTDELVRSLIRDAYCDAYKDALRDAFVILKQFKEFENISFETFKKELIK